MVEPADLWTSRVEPRFRDRAPRILRVDNGSDWWVTDGVQGMGAFAGAQAGLRFEEPEKLSQVATMEDVRPGGYIPEEHVKDMDADGIDVSLLYPTAGLQFYTGVSDGELLTDIFRVYNDWLAEFCKPFPDRLKGIAMLNTDEVMSGVKELERCARMGLIGAMITIYPPEARSYDLPEYEPLWAAAQDLGMPLSLHIGTNRIGPGQEPVDFQHIQLGLICNVDHWVRVSIAHMIYSGVFERYPKLQVGSVEQELSWVPHFLDRLDYNYTNRPIEFLSYQFKGHMLPSDFFHRNVFLGFQEDGLGIKLRNIIGVDNLLWGSDYPHQESTFPKSREIIGEILADCTEEEKAKIVGQNAARIYRLG